MKNFSRRTAGIVFLILFCLAAVCWADTNQEEQGQTELEGKVQESQQVENATDDTYEQLLVKKPVTEEETFPVPPPLVYQGLFPCQACHRSDVRGVSSGIEKSNSFLGKYIREPDPKPRTLIKMHRNINLRHAKWHWCLNCHDKDERNYLHLITGEKIPFEKSYRLCGQCHGIIYRDWKIGIHGRRVGNWNGKKLYLLCSHCHDPHSPKFRKLPAEDPPKKPNYGRWEVAGQE